MEKAKIVTVLVKGVESKAIIRGPLNDKDKHWGMRSNKNFFKKLGGIENG